ncbi:MAG: hypothetical protein ND866_08830 [Pyrinomonadaceae bacterium]|nr:hypothetical protein [Pyrinomonadaceae bacterium]
MQSELNLGEAAIYVWFVLAILTEVMSSFVLWMWLRRHGVKLVFGLTGIPGYSERAYLGWCKAHEHSGTTVLWLRALSILNVIAAAIVTIPLLIAK